MTEFKPGDIVRMRGDPDNPIMLVQHVDDHHITCAWFNGNKDLDQAGFDPEFLVKQEPLP
jgi:uncharacterized protein YodC (DUF2158 family)